MYISTYIYWNYEITGKNISENIMIFEIGLNHIWIGLQMYINHTILSKNKHFTFVLISGTVNI